MGLFKRFKDPVRGTAQVVAASHMPERTGRSNCRMNLVVQAEGMVPRSLEHTEWIVSTRKWPIPGQMLPVTVDRAKPDRVKIEWDEVPTHDEIARSQADSIAAGLSGTGTGTDAGDVPPQARDIVEQMRQMFPDATIHVNRDGGSPDAEAEARLREALGSAFRAPAEDGPGGGTDRIAELERLAKLRDKGVLTESEFQAEKARILGY